jgi:tetratricopeptide (TPR) repeat protein
LLPSLKPRFDPVQRGWLDKVLKDLKVQAADLAGAQPEVADLLKARYLVVGSATRFGGWIANARLVDLRTGLVVQTGKITAATEAELVTALPQLGEQLLMSDEERLAQKKAPPPHPPVVDPKAPIPPPPAPPAANVANRAPVPPALLNLPPAPGAGGIALPDLDRFPLQPPMFLPGAVQPLPLGPLDAVTRARLLLLTVDLGDQFFTLGRFADARLQYLLAFSLSPGEPLVLDRLNNLTPFLGVVDPLQFTPLLSRPRVVIFDFLTPGGPSSVPNALGSWTADNLVPYFASRFEVVDRGLAYWYMARLGLSLRDVALDPSARFWLGRALNARYFVFGALNPTASFDARTRVVDVELNYLVGEGRLHVRNPLELKLRLGELAQITMMSPADRAQFERGRDEVRRLIADAIIFHDQKNFVKARELLNRALTLQPGNLEALYHLQRALEQERSASRDKVSDLLARESQRDAIQSRVTRQLALDREQHLRNEDQRRKLQQEIDHKAAQQLMDFAKTQLDAKKQKQSINALQAAHRLQPGENVDRLLVKAKEGLVPAPNAKSPEPKREPDPKREVEFKRLVSLGTGLRKNRNWSAAKNALNEALKLRPGDPGVTAELKKADEGLLCESWMLKGRKALEDRQYADAVKLYTKALGVIRDEPDATKALRFAQRMQDGSALFKQEKYKQAADAFREARDAAKGGPFLDRAQQPLNQADYRYNLAEGKKSLKKAQKEMAGRGRDEALRESVRFFEAALRVYPADQEANQLRQQAQTQLKK